ncbi:MAG: hypothetical protein ACRDFC_07060 [Ignavibacteria bacterium]
MTEKTKDTLVITVDKEVAAVFNHVDNKSAFANKLLKEALIRKKLLDSPDGEYNLLLRRDVIIKLESLAKSYDYQNGHELVTAIVESFLSMSGELSTPIDKLNYTTYRLVKNAGV